MVNPTTKKTIGFLVPIESKCNGHEVQAAIDTLMEGMYKKIMTKEQRDRVKSEYKHEMEVLKW